MVKTLTLSDHKPTAPLNAVPCRAALCCAAKFSKRGPTKSSAARENLVFWDADYAWRFFTTRDSSGYCDWPQSSAEKMRRRER